MNFLENLKARKIALLGTLVIAALVMFGVSVPTVQADTACVTAHEGNDIDMEVLGNTFDDPTDPTMEDLTGFSADEQTQIQYFETHCTDVTFNITYEGGVSAKNLTFGYVILNSGGSSFNPLNPNSSITISDPAEIAFGIRFEIPGTGGATSAFYTVNNMNPDGGEDHALVFGSGTNYTIAFEDLALDGLDTNPPSSDQDYNDFVVSLDIDDNQPDLIGICHQEDDGDYVFIQAEQGTTEYQTHQGHGNDIINVNSASDCPGVGGPGDDGDDDGDGSGGGKIMQPRGDDDQELRITNEDVEQISDDSVRVSWETNIDASCVLYWGDESVDNPDEDDDNFGYDFREVLSGEDRDHKTEIDGLEAGEEYFFRPVCDSDDTDEEIGDEVSEELTIGEVLAAQTCGAYLEDFLRIDFQNDPVEVNKLEVFLNVFEGENLNIDGRFDRATFDAVARFQMKYADDVLNPWGYEDNQPTGYVYITTRNKINEILCSSLDGLTAAQRAEINQFNSLIESMEEPTYVFQLPVPQIVDMAARTLGVGGQRDADAGATTNTQTQTTDDNGEVLGDETTPTETDDTDTTTDTDTDTEDDDTATTTTIDEDDDLTEDDDDILDGVATSAGDDEDGILGFLLSPCFLLFILGLLLGLLGAELYKGRREA